LCDKLMPLPTKEEGYFSWLILGLIGVGKTTILRRVAGCDPKTERFPATAGARTTTAHLELITGDGQYEAVITFASRKDVKTCVEECVERAVLAAKEQAPDHTVMSRLLYHENQVLRLPYILGQWPTCVDDDFSCGDDSELVDNVKARSCSHTKKNHFKDRLSEHLAKVRSLASNLESNDDLREEDMSDEPEDHALPKYTDDWEESACQVLSKKQEFHDLVSDIMKDIFHRFAAITSGSFKFASDGWPQVWQYASENRKEFISQTRWFMSNYHREFGKLVTPLVDVIRIRGPFYPVQDGSPQKTKFILSDGRGLGHTPDSSPSLPKQTSRHFTEASGIIVVDNAKQPMLPPMIDLLRGIINTGHGEKIVLVFTHLDLISGDNFETPADMRDHVLNAVHGALESMRETSESRIVSTIERTLENKTFFLGELDKPTKYFPEIYSRQFTKLLDVMSRPPIPQYANLTAFPVYERWTLDNATDSAVTEFMARWNAYLGKGEHEKAKKKHWSTIKAFCRRMADPDMDDEYKDLRPIADMEAILSEAISSWLDEPRQWIGEIPSLRNRLRILAGVMVKVNLALSDFLGQRIILDQIDWWRKALEHSGRGSTLLRAEEIKRILEEAAPPSSNLTRNCAADFQEEVYNIVLGEITRIGGSFFDSIPE